MCAGDPDTKEIRTCHPYFTDKETEAERLHSLCVIAKILALVCAQSACLSPTSRLGIQEGLRKKHLSLTLCMDEPHPQLLGVMRATLSAQPTLGRHYLGKESQTLVTWSFIFQAWKPEKTSSSSVRFFTSCCCWGRGILVEQTPFLPGHFAGSDSEESSLDASSMFKCYGLKAVAHKTQMLKS